MDTIRPVHRFFVPDADPGSATVRLPSDEAHHFSRVLRLGPGASVRVFDGRGHEWRGTVEAAGRAGVVVKIDSPVTPAAEPPVRVTLAAGLQKGDRMETVVREATALGASAIVPLASTHVAVPARARDSKAAVERWQRVAVASAKQCGRASVPVVQPIATLEAILTAHRADRILMCVEPSRRAAGPARAAGERPASALVLVGPEGGWTDTEVDRASSAGATLVHLGPRTLRADLAPTVLLSALWTSWGWV
jgi:16S rRNA (uracil1498-N3)-methyltransferase